MERKRGTTIAIVAALIIAVVSLGISFAAFSSTLTINGTATVQTTGWSIFFASTSNGSKPGSAAALPAANINEHGSAKSTSTSLSADNFSWEATLKTPGDYVIYTFYARNTGDYNAKVRTTLAPTVTCTYDVASPTEGSANTFCASHVSYGIYKNADCTQTVSQNDPLTVATGYAQYWVKVELRDNFAANGTDLPENAVIVSAPVVSVIYDQDGSAVTQP